jgi:hypothetical protein
MKRIFLLFSIFYINLLFAQNYSIYGITQDFPMGEKDEVIRKNFYVTLGREQGVYPGTTLDVFRTLFIINSANPVEKINQRVKLGELKVIHSENQASIAILESNMKINKDLVFDFKGINLGDEVSPKVSSK